MPTSDPMPTEPRGSGMIKSRTERHPESEYWITLIPLFSAGAYSGRRDKLYQLAKPCSLLDQN